MILLAQGTELLSTRDVTVGGLLLFAVAALAVGWFVVPKWIYQASEERNKLLEEENDNLNASVANLTEQNGELKVAIARLTEQVENLRSEIQRLREASDAR